MLTTYCPNHPRGMPLDDQRRSRSPWAFRAYLSIWLIALLATLAIRDVGEVAALETQ
jgi:hypothetical protein